MYTTAKDVFLGRSSAKHACQSVIDSFVVVPSQLFEYHPRQQAELCDLRSLFNDWRHFVEPAEGLLVLMLASSSNTGLQFVNTELPLKLSDLIRIKQHLFSGTLLPASPQTLPGEVDRLIGLYLLHGEGFDIRAEDWSIHRLIIQRLVSAVVALPQHKRSDPELVRFVEWLVVAGTQNPLIMGQPVPKQQSQPPPWSTFLMNGVYSSLTRQCPVSLLSDQYRLRHPANLVQKDLLAFLINSAAREKQYPSQSPPAVMVPEHDLIFRNLPNGRFYQRQALVNLVLALARQPGYDAHRLRAIGCGVFMMNEWKMFEPFGRSEPELRTRILAVQLVLTKIMTAQSVVGEEYTKFMEAVRYLLNPPPPPAAAPAVTIPRPK